MATTKRRRTTPASRKSKVTLSGLASDLQTPALVAGGMIGGKYLGTEIDSLVEKMFPAPVVADTPVSGLAGTVKSYVTPLSLLLIGLVAPKFTTNTMARNAFAGVAVLGALKTVTAVTNTNFLAGFKGVKGLKGAPTMGRVLPQRIVARIPANQFAAPVRGNVSV